MQTSNFTPRFFEGFNTIKANEGWNGLYKGLGPLWMRQVPYTMVKFGAFENIVRAWRLVRSRRRWKAPTAPTANAVVRNAASTVWTSR